MDERDKLEDIKKKFQRAEDEFDLSYYERFLGKKPSKGGSIHWERADKTAFTLFNVLIDQDLSELVRVLEHFPDYIPLLCEHFRYSYSYNENPASLEAASELLFMGEPYMTKQFLRNVLAKLEKVDDMNTSEVKAFLKSLSEKKELIHPYILKYYVITIREWMEVEGLHLLQKKVYDKELKAIEPDIDLDILPKDRDKEVLIPYVI
ncbi:MAG: hypothetical protein ACOC08_00500 [Campylobacterales bacterium]